MVEDLLDKEEKTMFATILIVALLIILPLGYIVVGQFLGSVNNEPLPPSATQGQSHVADALAGMLKRDLDSGFCPSSYLWPGHIRFDTCGFQEGEQQIWQRVAMQLSDHLSREGAASDRDPDLNAVLANLNRPNTWSLLFSSNNTASLLGGAVKRLGSYDDRLRTGKAVYFPRIDNLSLLISDLTSIIGGEAQRLSDKAATTGFYSMRARYTYFHALGTLAASCITLQAAHKDFADVLKMQSAGDIFNQAMQKTCEKIGKDPAIVVNAKDLSHLLTLSGSASAAVNDLNALQTAIAAAPHNVH